MTDLHARLDGVRWPQNISPDGNWSTGTDLGLVLIRAFLFVHFCSFWFDVLRYMQELVHYWRHQYDFASHLQRIQAMPHFVVPVEGLRTHFLHYRSENVSAVPLILIHGWPTSFLDCEQMIPLLLGPSVSGISNICSVR
jgi:hypothetical protein